MCEPRFLCHFIRKIAFKSLRRALGERTTTICIQKQPPFPYWFHDQYTEEEAVLCLFLYLGSNSHSLI